ncbi:MAG: DUF4433 domain-containing protein [Gemmatimonadales bacterium]|nr:DUF4433 domain-containing protein [Gemmatimonadales bacterium]
MADIAILVTSLHKLSQQGLQFVTTDRHAYRAAAKFVSNSTSPELIDWKILRERDFKRDSNDPGKMERYQAEALVYRHLPTTALSGILCQGADQEQRLRSFSPGG